MSEENKFVSLASAPGWVGVIKRDQHVHKIKLAAWVLTAAGRVCGITVDQNRHTIVNDMPGFAGFECESVAR